MAQLQYFIQCSTCTPKSTHVLPAPADPPVISTEHSSSPPPTDSVKSLRTEDSPPSNLSDDTSRVAQRPPSDPIDDTTATPTSVTGYNVSRLPKLNIPVFAVDPLLWQPFWDSYEAAIHSNPVLSNVQKLTYLRA